MVAPTLDVRSRLAAASVSWRRLVTAFESFPVERMGFVAVAIGVVLRLIAPFFMDLRSDGDTYTAMGHAWMLHGEFLMPYGDVTTWAPTGPGHSNHYPPAYPFYLGLVFSVFGFGLWQAKWAAVVVSLAAVLVVYLTSRDLYGRKAGALAAGLAAMEPHLLWSTGAGFSENMVLMFFALTMWAIVKSLKDDRYIVLAGLFAGLTYLSRASVGYFFVIAGGGGFLWRLLFRGWGVLANRWYLGAIAVFGGIVAAWAGRNIALFGFKVETVAGSEVATLAMVGFLAAGIVVTLPFVVRVQFRRWYNFIPGVTFIALGLIAGAWLLLDRVGFGGAALATTYDLQWPLWETSSYTRYVQELAWEKSGEWRHALLAKIPFFLAFAVWYVVPLLPETWRAGKRILNEETSALWLSVVLVWVTAWAIAAMFWVFEKSSLFWLDNHRYVVIGLLPLGWLLLREARTHLASFRLRYGILLASLFVACIATIVSPVKFSDLHSAEYMDPYLRPGDEVAVDGGTIKYAFYAYLTNPEQIVVYGWTEGHEPDWVLSLKTKYDWDVKAWVCEPYEGYTQVADHRQKYWNGGEMTACLHAKPEIVEERDVVTGVVVRA